MKHKYDSIFESLMTKEVVKSEFYAALGDILGKTIEGRKVSDVLDQELSRLDTYIKQEGLNKYINNIHKLTFYHMLFKDFNPRETNRMFKRESNKWRIYRRLCYTLTLSLIHI